MLNTCDPVDDVIQEIAHLRRLTIDLLTAAPQSFLEFSPHPNMGSVWKIFRHMARVDENYIAAIRARSVNFGFDDSNYQGGNDRVALTAYLNSASYELNRAVKCCPPNTLIDWFGESCSLQTHLTRLATHESLHQGQLIAYARMTEVALPPSWADWGE